MFRHTERVSDIELDMRMVTYGVGKNKQEGLILSYWSCVLWCDSGKQKKSYSKRVPTKSVLHVWAKLLVWRLRKKFLTS